MNSRLREIYPESEELFDVVLMTNNHAYVGLRLINTINHHRELLMHMDAKNEKDSHRPTLAKNPFIWCTVCRQHHWLVLTCSFKPQCVEF